MKSNWAVLAILFLIGFSVFFNGLNGEFVHDDNLVLSHSFLGQPGKTIGFFSQPYFENFYEAGLYRPLTQISFAFNFLFGSSPFGFHLVNVLLHIINSFLVFLIVKRIRLIGLIGPMGPIATSLLFLVLPIHVEAVTSIVGRAELLWFFFGILTLLFWLDSKYLFSAATLLLALLSKETAVAIPAIMFLLGWYYKKRGVTHYFQERGPVLPHPRGAQLSFARRGGPPVGPPLYLYYSAVVLGYFILRIAVLGQYAFKTKVDFIFNPLAYVSFYERFSTVLKILVLYLQKIFIPYNLSADYSYDQILIAADLFSSPLSLAGLAVLGLMAWAVYRIIRGKKESTWIWALVFFFLPYLVISNFILLTGTIMAERLMYFPSLGMAMVLALVDERLFKFSKPAGLSFLLILCVIYGFMTISQNRVWLSREALLTDMYKKSPNSLSAKTNYGIMVLNRDRELAKKLSLEVYEKYPDYIQNLNLRAAVAVQDGDLIEAEKFLERALELRPKHQNTLQNISRVYFTLAKYQKAEEALKVLTEYGGEGNVIFYALVQAKLGKFDEARRIIYSFFGPQVEDDSALKILRGEYKELEDFFIFSAGAKTKL